MVTTLLALSDLHAGEPAEGIGASRKLTHLAESVLQEVLRSFREWPGLDGVLELGDLIQEGSVEVDRDNYRRALGWFNGLTVPVMHAIGNHPVMNLTEQAICDELDLRQPYYVRDIGEHRVIMLHSRFRHRRDSADHKSGSGIHIDEVQLEWLRRQLGEADKPVVVCTHHPLSDQDLRGNPWFEEYPQCALTENRSTVQEILSQSGNVVAVLNGHTHWNSIDVDRFGTPHVTLGSLVEDIHGNGIPAKTHSLVRLKDSSFNLEFLGGDLSLRLASSDPGQIALDLAATYDSIAEPYHSKTSQYGDAEIVQYQRLLEMLGTGHSGTVVDFGCGPARDGHFWRSRDFSYTGVDVSRGLLEIARRQNPDFSFSEGNFSTVDLKPNSAAVAIHNSSLQHVPRVALDETLRKVYETLEPGGIFYCHYRSGEGESLHVSREYGPVITRFMALYTEAEMEAALRRVGFRDISSVTFDHEYAGLKGHVVRYKTRTIARKPTA